MLNFRSLPFFALTVLAISLSHCSRPPAIPNLTGVWEGVDYQCPEGVFHREIVEITHQDSVLTILKLTGDDCVSAGRVSLEADVPGLEFDGTLFQGSPMNPNSGSRQIRLTIRDANHIDTDTPIYFERMEAAPEWAQ
ncbi:hypothetical protein [Pontibacter sp. G13]|uniref:hypothetical protein n=1 Tax=Pontibacter sp. G13 TaxID=3074898 RepID=UPI00288A0159|nr:hypothetical protein [Pontibacter sp. G13]WNJ19814.1 hypothetical protein RJD25_04965 [Pontibacter sp. G13]